MTLLGDKDTVLCTHGVRLDLQASNGKAMGGFSVYRRGLLSAAMAS